MKFFSANFTVDAVFKEANIAPSGTVNYADFIKFFAEPVPDY